MRRFDYAEQYKWWVCLDSNQGPLSYQDSALTSWATHPKYLVHCKRRELFYHASSKFLYVTCFACRPRWELFKISRVKHRLLICTSSKKDWYIKMYLDTKKHRFDTVFLIWFKHGGGIDPGMVATGFGVFCLPCDKPGTEAWGPDPFSLERRWSIRSFQNGYLVTT